MNKPVSLSCGHSACKDCMLQLVRSQGRSKSCSFCWATINQTQFNISVPLQDQGAMHCSGMFLEWWTPRKGKPPSTMRVFREEMPAWLRGFISPRPAEWSQQQLPIQKSKMSVLWGNVSSFQPSHTWRKLCRSATALPAELRRVYSKVS